MTLGLLRELAAYHAKRAIEYQHAAAKALKSDIVRGLGQKALWHQNASEQLSELADSFVHNFTTTTGE